MDMDAGNKVMVRFPDGSLVSGVIAYDGYINVALVPVMDLANNKPDINQHHGPHLTTPDVKRIVREMLGDNKGILLGDSESEGNSHANGP